LSKFLNVDNVGAERMSSGRLFQATGLVKLNACAVPCPREKRHIFRAVAYPCQWTRS